MKLSIIIPAYNEEEKIKNTLEDIEEYLSKKIFSYEIIVVNDGSTDRTLEVLKKFKKPGKYKNIKIISYNINQGKGFAVKKGMLAATGDYRLYIDADNAIKINHFDQFWFYMIKPEYDIVIGSIEVKGAKTGTKYLGFSKTYRHFLGKLSKYLIRALTIWEIHDTQRAFKLFNGDHAKEIFSRQAIMRWGFDIEILVISKKLGYKIKELPVEWINPPSESLNFISYLETLKELLHIKWNSMRDKYN